MIIKKPYLLLLIIIGIYTFFKIFLDIGDDSHVAFANANDKSDENIVRKFTTQQGNAEFDVEDERLRRLRQHDYIRDSSHRLRDKIGLANDYNAVRSKNSTKNHTLMKANIRDVIHILNNLKKIEIDPRQMQIYNKYKQQHDKNSTTDDTLQQSADSNSSSQQSQPRLDHQYIISHPFSSDKIDPNELDRLLRARTDVVHPHPFKYLINSPELCAPLIPSYSQSTHHNDGSVYILIYVHTSPGNYRRREVIRRTWGNCVQYAPDVSVRIVFVMGVHPEPDEAKAKSLNESLKLEQDLYGDLVQEDFIDSYHNLTYKGVAALKWISLFCPNAKFILKTDDDIFVNMFSLIKYFKHLEKDENNLKGLIMCAVWYGMPVLRTGKWKVLKEEWAGDWYPTYCSGSAFIMSTDVAMILHEVSYHVPFFWVDDFYITGLLPLKAGNIAHRQFGSAYVLNGDLLEEYFTGPQWQSYIFSHLKELDRILKVWKKMSQLAKRETVAEIKKVLPGQLPAK